MKTFSLLAPITSTLLGSQTSAAEDAHSRDRAALQALTPRYAQAWSAGDAGSLADTFTADGDLIIPSGTLIAGTHAIAAFYREVLESAPYSGSLASAVLHKYALFRLTRQ